MKNIKFILFILLLLNNIVFSQTSYLSTKEVVPLFDPSYSGVDPDQTVRRVFFDLSEVNNTNERLDLVGGISEFQIRVINTQRYYDVDCSLYLNSNDTNFNDLSSTFTSQNLIINGNDPGESNSMKELLFAQLRSSAKKDVVVLRDSNICIYRNSNGDINLKLDSMLITDVQNISVGILDYQDELEDIIIFHDDTIKIYKSNNNGTIDRSYYPAIPYGTNIGKIISKQINIENQPYRTINYPNGTLNKDEIIFSSDSNIYIYANSNNNSFTYSQTISLPDSVLDFEIDDVNNDGWNDLLAAGQNSGATSRYMRVFLNNGGGTISSTAVFSIATNVITDCKISTGDFNKDGWNDIVMGGRDTIRIFENIKVTNLFSTSNIVNYIYNSPTISLPKKLISADLTNLGGLSVLFSGKTQTLYESDPTWIKENILRMNPSVKNTNPAPAYLFRSTAAHNGYLKPRLLLFNRGDRDFLKYKIYKKGTYTSWTWRLWDSTTSDNYIDTIERLDTNSYPGVPATYNLYYYVRAEDASYKMSTNSDTVNYLDIICPTCPQGPDNSVLNDLTPTQYSVFNYPNPFNPTTKIHYAIPKSGIVKIIVYNSLGQKIIVLIDELKMPGMYSVLFDGSNFSSGIYYYRIEADNFTSTKKMLLIK